MICARNVAVAFALALLLTACSLRSPAPDPTIFSLVANRPAAAPAAPLPYSVRVRDFRQSIEIDTRSLVYRLDEVRFATDFYNVYLATPAALVAQNTETWLRQAVLFTSIVGTNVPVDTDFVLDAEVLVIFGDYRDPARPAAMIAVHYYLWKETGATRTLVFNKPYVQRVPIATATPDALVRGFSTGLGNILGEFERDLRAANLKSSF
jgi:uncharacterized lipoprotein YmbA